MEKRIDPDEIKKHWQENVREHCQSHKASWSDTFAIELETRTIAEHLQDGDSVLDVGCSNGHATLQYAMKKKISIKGLDYLETMIEQARLNFRDVAKYLIGDAHFDVGDVTALQIQKDTYDKVIATRVIINLGDWACQCKGLFECVRVLKPKGFLLLSEAILQSWNQLNRFRREWHLPDIPMPSFNNYLDRERVVDFLSPHASLIGIHNFSSTYYVGTRVLKPILSKALNNNIEISEPNMEWNRWFSKLPSIGDYGIQQLMIFQKN
jgi:ubiquinone/menaquinone biosynthesis C-methylase UbiE